MSMEDVLRESMSADELTAFEARLNEVQADHDLADLGEYVDPQWFVPPDDEDNYEGWTWGMGV